MVLGQFAEFEPRGIHAQLKLARPECNAVAAIRLRMRIRILK